MKKLIYFLIGFLVLTSCSSSYEDNEPASRDDAETVVRHLEFESVQNQIDSLNLQLFKDQVVQTRSKHWFFKVCSIVMADATGSILGSFWGGPVGSVSGMIFASAYKAFTSNNLTRTAVSTKTLGAMNSSSRSLTNVVPTNRAILTQNDSIGYYHNLILLDLNNSLRASSTTIDTLIVAVANRTSVFYNANSDSIIKQINYNSDLYLKFSSDEFAYDNFESLHDYVEAWIALYPDKASELLVMEAFLEGIVNLDVNENDGNYLNRVLEIVESSDLDADDKQVLNSALIVGNASYQLWNTDSVE